MHNGHVDLVCRVHNVRVGGCRCFGGGKRVDLVDCPGDACPGKPPPVEVHRIAPGLNAMHQTAPWPAELEDLIKRWRYRPGWRAWLERDQVRDPKSTHGAEGRGLTLCILADVMDTYHPELRRPVLHSFIVPAATYNRASWLRWLRDCVIKVETHESMEWFVIREGAVDEVFTDTRPFAPLHGPGEDPYALVEYATDVQRNTSFRGVVKDG